MAETPSTPDHSDPAETTAHDTAAATPPQTEEPSGEGRPFESAATPDAVPTPVPTAAPSVVPPVEPLPSVAATMEIPPLPGAGAADTGSTGEEGGEWNLLVSKVKAWFGSGEPQRQWERLREPLKLLAIVVGLVMALRLYSSLVRTIDSIPVISGLLELTGLIALVRFSLANLVKRSEREALFDSWSRRWSEFRGRG